MFKYVSAVFIGSATAIGCQALSIVYLQPGNYRPQLLAYAVMLAPIFLGAALGACMNKKNGLWIGLGVAVVAAVFAFVATGSLTDEKSAGDSIILLPYFPLGAFGGCSVEVYCRRRRRPNAEPGLD